MKKILLLTVIVSTLINCQADKKIDNEKITFNIRKYLLSEDILNQTILDDSKIQIDSINEYPKYKYLERKIEISKETYKMILTGKDEKNKNLQLNIIQSQIDSVTKIYKQTKKSENYYKCYSLVKSNSNSQVDINYTFLIDNKSNVVEYLPYSN
ncbi:hypothetical protein [Flavimarina sp. Hel_I_48]|uniref:hypothetical protein n=1 Tax=Flavimarina sp. Hel_I_48 TaxID=1392488 RepID=UPI0004DF69DB|nr:hypothetical protein [Flavimarina sp. Hel_I_48]